MTRNGYHGFIHMRGAGALMVLAACGRFGFTDRIARDAAADALGRACMADSDCAACQGCEGGHCTSEPLDLVLGHRTTCFIGNGGSRWCVGEEPGLVTTTASSFPARNVGEDGWTSLAPGWYQSFGIRNGETYQWGSGSAPPSAYSPDGTYTSISIQVGDYCMQHSDDDLACDGSAVAGTWSDADAGVSAFCGVQPDHSLWCWGTDGSNALGQGVEANGTVVANPARVGSATDWSAVAIGANLACGQKLDGTLWCWGSSSDTGTNGVDTMGVPTQISPDTDWTWFNVHWQHACAGKADGSVWCWGLDEYGLEVVPGMTEVPVPMQVPSTWDRFVMGGHHYCGLMAGSWYCWGWNAAGQLGIGTKTTHQMPTVPFCTQGT